MLHQTPPGRGGRKNVPLHFTNRKVPRKTGYDAWIAGPIQWYTCHTITRPTKPCLKIITDGVLACPRCGTKEEVMGYVPLFDAAESKPVLALVHENDRERLDAIPHHQAVHVFREDRDDAGISITPYLSKNFPRFVTALDAKKHPVDITRALVTIWAQSTLTDWFNAQLAASDTPVSLKKEKPTSISMAKYVKNLKDGVPNDMATFGGAMLGDAVNDVLEKRNAQFAAEARKTSKNGKPHGSTDGE